MEVSTLVIGIDSHKENHAACAIDELSGQLAEAVATLRRSGRANPPAVSGVRP